VKGQKLRAADPTFESMLKAAGASTSAMASSEIYPALQSGVLTGALTSAETFVSGRLYEQTKHATVGGANSLWMLLQPLVMSKQHWDKLTATNAMAEAYRKAGGTPREMTDDEYKQWMALAKKTAYPEYAAISPTAKRILDALEKSKAAK
jgi:TRAP-type C4-dicarboxylate transport system substrate-binding protein